MLFILVFFLVGLGGECVSDTSSCQLAEVKHTCPQQVTGLVSRLVFTGSIPRTPHKPVVSKTSEADI